MTPRQVMRSVVSRVLPRRYFQTSGPASSRAVCLTFDDGPDPEHTPRVLDALRDAGAVATFFLVGEKAARSTEIVRRIVAEGHALGNHTFYHPRPEDVGPSGLVAEARRTNEVLAAIVGRGAKMIRLPYGGVSLGKLIALWRSGLSVILWSVDPKDFTCRSADEVRDNLRRRPLRAGDIILMHDDHPFAAEVIPALVADARRLGLTLTTPLAWGRPPL